MNANLCIRDLGDSERESLGRLMVEVYAGLEDFPGPDDQPQYYAMLANIWQFTARKDARVLVAVTEANEIVGGVVYFGDMTEYSSGGTAQQVRHASGIRLLAVEPRFRGSGTGRALTQACIDLAQAKGHARVVLHTTAAMKVAWGMYERLGFERATDLDFLQEELPVFGLMLALAK